MVFACVNSASQVAEDPVWPARSQAGRSHRPFQESLWVSALFWVEFVGAQLCVFWRLALSTY